MEEKEKLLEERFTTEEILMTLYQKHFEIHPLPEENTPLDKLRQDIMRIISTLRQERTKQIETAFCLTD